MTSEKETTKTDEIQNVFEWNIRNFTSLVAPGEKHKIIESPVFVAKSLNLPNSFWKIIVHKPMPSVDFAKDNNLHVFLQLNKELNQHNPVIKVRFQLFLKKRDEQKMFTSCTMEFSEKASAWGAKDMVSFSNLMDKYFSLYLNNDTLCIQIKLWVLNEGVKLETELPALPQAKEQLHKDFSQLLDSPEFSDVTIVTEDLTLNAHKVILSCRSPVFAAMFQANMSECLTNTVRIEEFCGRTVKAMLQFMYSGSTEGVNEIYMDLLRISDKYQLEELKLLCAKTALLNISTENVIELLIVGDLHNFPELKSKAIDFINSNKAKFIFSSENADGSKLEKLADEHPKLLLEIYKNSLLVPYTVRTNETIEIEEMTTFTTNKRLVAE